MSAAGRMTFARVETTYFVPRDRVFELRGRGEAAVAQLGTALENVLAPIVPADDPSVWVIRRLDVDVGFAAEIEDVRALAQVWASEITRTLVRALRDGEDVVRYTSRAAYIAQFVADSAAGRDTGCWYYEPLASLRSLPRSAMIREAIVREPEEAAAMLYELARMQRLAAVLDALHEESARAICEVAFPSSDVSAASAHMIEVLLALADVHGIRDATPQNVIALCVAMHEHSPSLDMGDVRAHVDRLLAFAAMLASSDDPWQHIEPISAFFSPLPPALITCAAGTFLATRQEPVTESAFAGLALLLRPLAEMDIEDDGALRREIAVQCAIGAGRDHVLHDPVMALFGEEDGDVDGDRAAALAQELFASFSACLIGFAGSSDGFLYENFIEGIGTIREMPETTVIELPPVPLAIVLRIGGVDGTRFTLPWLPERTIELRLRGQA